MSDLAQLAAKLFNPAEASQPKIVSTEKRVRGKLAGVYIFDTTAAKMVWENGYFPSYWIPHAGFLPTAKFTTEAADSEIQPSKFQLQVNTTSITVLRVPDSFNSELAGYVKVQHKDLESWWEEESQSFYHPKDPFHRVDVLPTGRHIRVELDGVVLADTHAGGAMSLWETKYPGRWYVPKSDVNMEYLKDSKTVTGCPYKGQASYYHALINGKLTEDVAWWYEDPIHESAEIKGLLCFYPNKVQTFLDGKPLENPIAAK